MLDIANDILSLTDFKRRSSELLRRVKKTRKPIVLTVNGKAELVVQSAGDYQQLLETIEAMESIAGVRRGLESMKAGKGRQAAGVFRGMERKHPYLRRP